MKQKKRSSVLKVSRPSALRTILPVSCWIELNKLSCNILYLALLEYKNLILKNS